MSEQRPNGQPSGEQQGPGDRSPDGLEIVQVAELPAETVPGELPAESAWEGEPTVEVLPRWETRKRRSWWERSRLLILIAAVWGVLFWYAVSSDPLISVRDALVQTWNAKWWLTVLFAAEFLRQAHYLFSEHWGRWNHFWLDGFFGGLSRRTGRIGDWGRYRAKRVLAVVIVLAAIAIIAGAIMQEDPITAFFSLPGVIVGALPTFFTILLYMLVFVGQIVLLF